MDANTDLLEILVTEYVLALANSIRCDAEDEKGMKGKDRLPIDPFVPIAVKAIKQRRSEIMALMRELP